MKIVIDIPEVEFERLQRDAGWTNLVIYRELIKNGTPLPKGHGRLIDADDLIQMLKDRERYGYLDITDIDHTPTIIEVDKEEEHETCD